MLNRTVKTLFSAAVVLGAVSLTAAMQDSTTTAPATPDKPAAPEKATVDALAPNFTLKDSNGATHSLSDFKGKIVVLEWFSSACPYSGKESGASVHSSGRVADAQKQMKEIDENVVYLLIDSTANQPADKVKEASVAALKKYGNEAPLLMDYSGQVGHMYGARTTPHVYVIDEEGILRYSGAFDDNSRGKNPESTNYAVNTVKQIKAGETVSPSETRPWGCGVKYNRNPSKG